jgi:hypothetical protein
MKCIQNFGGERPRKECEYKVEIDLRDQVVRTRGWWIILVQWWASVVVVFSLP